MIRTRLRYDTNTGITLDREFQITVINRLRALMEKLDTMQKGNVSREKEALRENQKHSVRNKVSLTGSSVDWMWPRKKISELDYRSIQLAN